MHDHSGQAWIVVGAYLCTALLSYWAGRTAAAQRHRNYWLWTALLLLGLGINKQLDLQTALTSSAARLARAGDWYESRRTVQAIFLLVLFVGLIGGAALLLKTLRGAPVAVKIAALGTLTLLGFVFMRAASFHHIDQWLAVGWRGLRQGWWLELAGCFLIASAATLALVRRGTRRAEH